ncbi:MAG: tetratricopeptide repeat protein [Candidatus Helarchaeota archaeon]
MFKIRWYKIELDGILEDLRKDDLQKIEEATKKLLDLDKEDFENYGFDDAINKIFEIIELFEDIESKRPEFWKRLKDKKKIEKWDKIIENIRDKLRDLDLTSYDLNDKGIEAQDKDDDDRALIYYKQAVLLDPNYRWSWYNLGNVYRNKDNNEKAIECYKKAVKIYPDYGDAWNNMGNAYSDLDKLNDALEVYEKAASIESYENRNFPIYNIGLIYEKKGDKHKALEYFKKALEVKGDYAKAQYNAGRILYEMGNILEAQKYFTLALTNDFENYYKDIAEFNINVYNLLAKHLINDFIDFKNLNVDIIQKDVKEIIKNIFSRNYFGEKEINFLLNDPEYIKNWKKSFTTGKAEIIENFINNCLASIFISKDEDLLNGWINEDISKMLNNNEIDYEFLRIELILKFINNFPGDELSQNIRDKLNSVIIESYDYFKKTFRLIRNYILSHNINSAEEYIDKFLDQIENEAIKTKYRKEYVATTIKISEFLRDYALINNNLLFINLNEKIILWLLENLDNRDASIEVAFFLLESVDLFYKNKKFETSLKCAIKAKEFFNKLEFIKDSQKVEKIIKKIEILN